MIFLICFVLLITTQGTPIIYVNMNYRLGPLGFPQGQEAQDNGALNLGLKDQLAGLKWIQANIHAFGGDKSKVLSDYQFLILPLTILGHCIRRKCRRHFYRRPVPELGLGKTSQSCGKSRPGLNVGMITYDG